MGINDIIIIKFSITARVLALYIQLLQGTCTGGYCACALEVKRATATITRFSTNVADTVRAPAISRATLIMLGPRDAGVSYSRSINTVINSRYL